MQFALSFNAARERSAHSGVILCLLNDKAKESLGRRYKQVLENGSTFVSLICSTLFSSPGKLIDPHCQCTRDTEIHCSESMSQNFSIQLEQLKSQESIHSTKETEPNLPAIAAIKSLLFYYCYNFFT